MGEKEERKKKRKRRQKGGVREIATAAGESEGGLLRNSLF